MQRREFEREVDKALDQLPDWVLERVDNLIVVVEERPSADQDPDGSILGIYEGVSLLDRGSDYWGELPDRITVFRQPHLALELPDAELRREIHRTVLHEVAHYLGIEEDRLSEIGWD
ncbi:MAG TPA: metallopeptidase family protein [Acidimicrobiia bacterium]|jgi:predicted Zn-dependent protease with MMP-like domain